MRSAEQTRGRTAHPDTFVVERTYAHPVEAVWSAFADPAVKAQWFGSGDFEDVERSEDFRAGGVSINDGRTDGGMSRFRAVYTDIVEHERIVYSYDMWLDDRHASTSITTILLEPTDDGTALTFIEQGIHLDGVHGSGPAAAAGRAEGSAWLLGRIDDVLSG